MTDTPPEPNVQHTQPPAQQQTQQDQQSAQHWQSQFDKANQANQQLASQLSDVQAQLNAMQQASAPTDANSSPPPDFNNWNSWKNDNGEYKQEYVDAVFHPDLPSEVRQTLLNTINDVNAYTQQQMDQAIDKVFGTKENLTAALDWAKSALPEYERTSLNQALQNPSLAPMALQALQTKAEAAGVFEQQTQGASEPSPLPSSDGNPQVGLTPLEEGSPEAAEAIADPRYRTDPAYQKQVAQRLALGAKNSNRSDITSML